MGGINVTVEEAEHVDYYLAEHDDYYLAIIAGGTEPRSLPLSVISLGNTF